jgi:lipopolysaccharide export system ATP-binding protein
MSLLKASHLRKSYGGKEVVSNVSIEVKPGSIVGLLGPNGAGKTTTFKMIVGRVEPNGGEVNFNNTDVTKQPMYKRAQLGMSYLAQEPSIFDGLSVEDNILSILEFYESNRQVRAEKLEKLLAKLELTRHAKTKSSALSGGERRRLEITRALITEPKLILLDEPFAGVDPIVVEEIQRIVHILKKDGLGILITDHNVPATLGITDHTYIIQNGSVLISGSPREIANSEVAKKEYLGNNFILHEPT